MSDSKHSRKAEKKNFCGNAVSGGKCKCGNDYQKNGEAPGAWGKKLGVNARGEVSYKTKSGGQDNRRFEAHHVLCVATVNAQITNKDGIGGIVAETKWCVNAKGNMEPMPMLAHTVRWYSILGKTKAPPPFANIPQHDWDHAEYIREVKVRLEAIAKAVKDSKKTHKATSKDLKADMDSSAKAFKAKLKGRGLRGGGTHKAFDAGVCDPFSMAPSGLITKRPFPSGKLEDKIDQWVKKLRGGKK